MRRQRGLKLRFTTAESPLGVLLIAATDSGLHRISLGDDEESMLAEIRLGLAEGALQSDHGGLRPWADGVLHNLRGSLPLVELPIDVPASDFQLRVWLELRCIPYGDTLTYSDLARRIGRPDAVRAVATACASNQLAVVIPCHRVLREDGNLGGYRWGIERKRALIDFERRQRGGAGIRDGGQCVLEF